MGRVLSVRDGFFLVGGVQIDLDCVPGKQGLSAGLVPDEEKLVLGAFDLVATVLLPPDACATLVVGAG